MNLIKKFFCIVLASISLIAHGKQPEVVASLDGLIEAFGALPKNRDGATYRNSGFEAISLNKHDQVAHFKQVVGDWMKMRAHQMDSSVAWKTSNLGTLKPESAFFSPTKRYNKFTPYVEKVDAKSGDRFILRGDLHGDISSLVEQLKDMKAQGLIGSDFKLKQGVTMGFLGDYVDRGHYGLEVLYTLARLGNANPDNVLYVRGNHEDLNISAHYGFKDEIREKFNDTNGDLHQWIGRMYDYMPTAIFLGDQSSRFVQLCHGGIEQGYNPQGLLTSDKKYQLIGALQRAESVKNLLQSAASDALKKALHAISPKMKDGVVLRHPCDSDVPLGFMWNDFDPTGKNPEVIEKPGRGLEYGQSGVDAVLRQQQGSKVAIMGIIRAHQHAQDAQDPMMQNIKKGGGVWNMRGCGCDKGIGADVQHKDVLTLNVAPDGGDYGVKVGFDDDSAIEVVPCEQGAWSLTKHKYYPFKKVSKKIVPRGSGPGDATPPGFTTLQKGIMISAAVLCGGLIARYVWKKYQKQQLIKLLQQEALKKEQEDACKGKQFVQKLAKKFKFK